MKEIIIVFEMDVDCVSKVAIICDDEEGADRYIKQILETHGSIYQSNPRLKKVFYKVKAYENTYEKINELRKSS